MVYERERRIVCMRERKRACMRERERERDRYGA